MKQSLVINGREHILEWAKPDVSKGDVFSCAMDGEPFEAQVAKISPGAYSILIAGKSYAVRVAANAAGDGGSSADANRYSANVDGTTYSIAVSDPRRWSRGGRGAAREGSRQITAPMPGKVVRVLVAEGEQVAVGQGLIVVEAMKMQNEIKAPVAGIVKNLLVAAGQPVSTGESLVVIE